MDHDKVILDFLVTGFGTVANPKSDGRVEIPQSFVQTMNWGKCNKLYMSYDDGAEFYISEDFSFHEDDKIFVEVAVTKGRVRIPARFLKQIRMSDKSLVFTEADGAAVARVVNSHNEERILAFLNTLDYDSVKQLAELLLDVEPVEEEEIFEKKSLEFEIPHGEIARVSVSASTSPELILLSTESSTVFRPVGNPYKFTAGWKNKEIVFYKDVPSSSLDILYLIPGIQRIKQEDKPFRFGFLLVDARLFTKICQRIVKDAERTTAEGVEMIFIYSLFSKGSFKVYENPKEELDPNIILKAKNICSNPEQFLLNTFTVIDGCSTHRSPLSVNANTVEISR